jgi:ethanolamine utilization protein EutN
MEVDVGTLSEDGRYIIAVDAVGAGIGEEVLVSQGSSGRLALRNVNTPTDAVIVGIIDQKQGS